MPTSLIYLGIMLAIILLWFLLLKRPVYEGILISFIVLLTVTGTWGNVFTYIEKSLSTSLLYSMVAFVSMSIILTKTKIIDSCIAVILSLLGRITGGAGYAAVIASAFMGALSGSGPGNVMATMAGVGGAVGGMVGGMMQDAMNTATVPATPSNAGNDMATFKAKVEKLTMMKEAGLLSEEEFDSMKAKLLSEIM